METNPRQVAAGLRWRWCGDSSVVPGYRHPCQASAPRPRYKDEFTLRAFPSADETGTLGVRVASGTDGCASDRG